MAKKKSKNNSTIFDLVAFIFAGAVFGLLAMPYILNKASVLGRETVKNISGYSLLNFEVEDKTFAILVLLLIIFAGLTVIFSLLKTAVDAKMITNKTFIKVTKFCLLVCSLALVVTSIVTMIMIPTKCDEFAITGIVSAGNYAGWLGLILTTVASILSFGSNILSLKK